MSYKILGLALLALTIAAYAKEGPQTTFIIKQIEAKTSVGKVQPEGIRNVRRGKYPGINADIWCGEVHLADNAAFVGGWRPFSIIAFTKSSVIVDVWQQHRTDWSNAILNASSTKANESAAKAISGVCQYVPGWEPPVTTREQYQPAWYQGGTLHNATAVEWLAGSSSNRLATSADFIAKLKAADSVSQLKVRAAALSSCITEAASTSSSKQVDIKDVAVSCIILLGYK